MLCDLLKSGYVRRWHSNPDMSECGENNAQHQWSVAMIVWKLRPNISRGAILLALTHDVGELFAGDLGWQFKRENQKIADAHQEFEFSARSSAIPEQLIVSEDEASIVKLADSISAWNTMMRFRPELSRRADWVGQFEDMERAAKKLSLDLSGVVDVRQRQRRAARQLRQRA